MKKKLSLSELQVTSFVTSMENPEKKAIHGASGDLCPTNPCITPVFPSKVADCFFTRFDHNCLVAVSGGPLC